MSDILLESLRWGGSYFLEGVRERGGIRPNPPEPPPGYGPENACHTRAASSRSPRAASIKNAERHGAGSEVSYSTEATP